MECMKCQTEMIHAELKEALHGTPLYVANKKKGVLGVEHRSNVTCYVCPGCGYIELRADMPKDLIIQ